MFTRTASFSRVSYDGCTTVLTSSSSAPTLRRSAAVTTGALPLPAHAGCRLLPLLLPLILLPLSPSPSAKPLYHLPAHILPRATPPTATRARLWCPTRQSGTSLAEEARVSTRPTTSQALNSARIPITLRVMNAASLSGEPTSKSVKPLSRLGSGSCISVSARRSNTRHRLLRPLHRLRLTPADLLHLLPTLPDQPLLWGRIGPLPPGRGNRRDRLTLPSRLNPYPMPLLPPLSHLRRPWTSPTLLPAPTLLPLLPR